MLDVSRTLREEPSQYWRAKVSSYEGVTALGKWPLKNVLWKQQGGATSTLESNMAVSVFQDPVLGTPMPSMDDQTYVGMEREVLGQTMSTDCQVFVKISALLLYSILKREKS